MNVKDLLESIKADECGFTNKSERLYIRDYAMRTNYITNVEVVTYG